MDSSSSSDDVFQTSRSYSSSAEAGPSFRRKFLTSTPKFKQIVNHWRAFFEKKLEDVYNGLSQQFEIKRAELSDQLSKTNDEALELQFQGLEDEMYETLCERRDISKTIKNIAHINVDYEKMKVNVLIDVWENKCEILLQKLEKLRKQVTFLAMKKLIDNID